MSGLTGEEIRKVVYHYIGVIDGYLGNFTYKTHAEFYSLYCELDIDPKQYAGTTTREKFIAILRGSSPETQAKILRGVIARFPVTNTDHATRTENLRNELLEIIERLESGSPVSTPSLKITTATVELAISDAEALLKTNGATSGVDRIHTALHGYLKKVCLDAGIAYESDDTITKLFKLLRQKHVALKNLGARQNDIEKIFQAFGTIMDALNPIRNKASIAHPNENLLEKDEAFLVINSAKTILHYLDAKFSAES